ncbi:chorismate synthase [Anaerobranca californiensis DSM 14826]|jgi:chorismate synthase|uniref:Chorismate synthase n=1 Tax=Anaerobranca californiensis DSM 14826 TaxID=1120989 RepID=A0A1M6KSJ9_9FIRM|nr:chorismate synthase [Anaerobranca californiensis]SHJ61941.1 chorismate synthase [Anaerobranca californiensis DSM 14826]
MRYLTAGESHNKGLVAILEGIPAGVLIDENLINLELSLRQGGYGRGDRMKIEKDRVEIISGVRMGYSIGSPISLFIPNNDWQNYKDKYHQQGLEYYTPRPGHGDLPGVLKYNFSDCRNVLERASARETAVRVAVGSICQQFLSYFNIKIHSFVLSIGPVKIPPKTDDYTEIYQSQFYTLDKERDEELIRLVDRVKRDGDSLGGVVETVIEGLPPGLGSYIQHDLKLDGLLAGEIMAIPSVKGVEFGLGFSGTKLLGSEFHDPIVLDQGIKRPKNNAGGIEGGMSNGEKIVIRSAIKPIPTLLKGMDTINLKNKEKSKTDYQRSDVTVVPAASVVIKNVVAFVIAQQFHLKFGGDHLQDTLKSYYIYRKRIEEFFYG